MKKFWIKLQKEISKFSTIPMKHMRIAPGVQAELLSTKAVLEDNLFPFTCKCRIRHFRPDSYVAPKFVFIREGGRREPNFLYLAFNAERPLILKCEGCKMVWIIVSKNSLESEIARYNVIYQLPKFRVQSRECIMLTRKQLQCIEELTSVDDLAESKFKEAAIRELESYLGFNAFER